MTILFTRPSVVAEQQQATTGLIFPENSASADDRVAFKFTGAGLLDAYPATYIWKYYPYEQAGYQTPFFYANTQYTTFDSGNGYYGFGPYPKSASAVGVPKWWEISVNGTDIVTDDNENDTTVIVNQWYDQMAIVTQAGAEITLKFYWDLSRDVSRVITHTTNGDFAGAFPPSGVPGLYWGGCPWSDGVNNEMGYGIHRGIQIYSSAFTLEQGQSSITTPGSVATPWYLKINPTPTDITDDSGNGHDMAWQNDNRPTLWEG